jgi:hypothetical protein
MKADMGLSFKQHFASFTEKEDLCKKINKKFAANVQPCGFFGKSDSFFGGVCIVIHPSIAVFFFFFFFIIYWRFVKRADQFNVVLVNTKIDLGKMTVFIVRFIIIK